MDDITWGIDGNGSLYAEWIVGADGRKRAWVQIRTGDRDWAGCGRYVNVARIVAPGGGPRGVPADFPVTRTDACDRTVLEDFVRGIRGAVSE